VTVPYLTRRAAVRGVLVTVVGGVAGFFAARTSSAARAARGTTAANAYGPSPGSAGKPLLPLSRLPAGGGVVLGQEGIVLARSAGGQVHAFSAVCTHQGCTVGVSGRTLACPCHGSVFNLDTGAVLHGPAARPLPSIQVSVRNGEVFRS
jgi:nitrite reductase/ring-hydroxylating ferredoxin subunit